tara:strand:- start:818 stop:976 length:159 start_codon:yes stop_codon:yes gene_type:complete
MMTPQFIELHGRNWIIENVPAEHAFCDRPLAFMKVNETGIFNGYRPVNGAPT